MSINGVIIVENFLWLSKETQYNNEYDMLACMAIVSGLCYLKLFVDNT